MTFDNTSSAIRIQISKAVCTIAAGVLIALTYTTQLWSYAENAIGVSKAGFTVFLLVLLAGYLAFHLLRRSQFVYFSDKDSKIIIRFYTLTFFDSKKNAYEIPKGQFVDVKVKNSLFNIKKEVIVRQKIGANIAQYPPFSITALPKKDQAKLLSVLESYSM